MGVRGGQRHNVTPTSPSIVLWWIITHKEVWSRGTTLWGTLMCVLHALSVGVGRAGGSVVGVLVWITFPANWGLESIQITVQGGWEALQSRMLMTKQGPLQGKGQQRDKMGLYGLSLFNRQSSQMLATDANNTPAVLTHWAAATSVWPKI